MNYFRQYPVTSELNFFKGQHIIPVSDSDGAISLSAILLDDEYFAIIKNHAVQNGGINIINELALIPFKAKAYLEIKERGEDSKNWKKHRADIINLAVTLLTEETKAPLSGKVRAHFLKFMEQLKLELNPDIIIGACNQKINKEIIITLLENTFL